MKSRMESKMSSPVVVGVDIGKEVFHLVGITADGKIALRRRIRRLGLKDAFEKLPLCIVAMETCLSAHFVSRTLRALGHEPRIVPAIYVKPFLKGQKNDYNDAEAIAEAATAEPAVRPGEEPGSAGPAGLPPGAVTIGVPSNSDDQPDPRLSDRARHCCQGRPRALRKSLFAILDNRKEEISPRTAKLIRGLYDDWCCLDERIETVTGEIEILSRSEAKCRQLMSVPGVGPLISTATVAAIGSGEAFERGRDFAAWLGLVLRQYSTGGRSILGRISKRGSKYLRTLLIQAAKVLLMRPHNWARYSFGPWLNAASERLHRNKLAVALANKLARIAWSVLRNDKAFDTHIEVAAI